MFNAFPSEVRARTVSCLVGASCAKARSFVLPATPIGTSSIRVRAITTPALAARLYRALVLPNVCNLEHPYCRQVGNPSRPASIRCSFIGIRANRFGALSAMFFGKRSDSVRECRSRIVFTLLLPVLKLCPIRWGKKPSFSSFVKAEK